MKETQNEPSYAVSLRKTNPEKMLGIEKMIELFAKKILLPDEKLNTREIMLIANSVVNNLHKKQLNNAADEEINEVISDALYAGVDTRLKLKNKNEVDPLVK